MEVERLVAAEMIVRLVERKDLLRSIIISPDSELAQKLESAVSIFGEVAISRKLNQYPSPVDLTRALRAHAPDVVFLSFEAPDKAMDVASFIHSESKGVQVVALGRDCDAALLRNIMRAGIRECLALPFERHAVSEALRNVREMMDRQPAVPENTNHIYSFLPAKAGAGTSTMALNVAGAMARRPSTPVLLSDFDLNSGMTRFVLKLQNDYSVQDAVEHAGHIDENLWPQLVTSVGSLDVLHAGRISPNVRIEPSQIRNLIEFMRRNYAVLCFDLSGNLERYSMEIMQESLRIFMVCTLEVPSLFLAREKLAFLRGLELDDRVSVVLNRCSRKPLLTKQQVEDVLGVPVTKMIPNDYHGVNHAITSGKLVAQESELGKQFTLFANELLDKKQHSAAETKHKFLDFFAVPSTTRVAG